ATAHVRRHRLEQFPPAIQDADAHRPDHLVPGERQEIDTELLYVHAHVRDALSRVDQYQGAGVVRFSRQFLDRVDRPQRVRNLRDGHHSDRLVPQELIELVHTKPAVVVYIDITQVRAGVLGDELPGDDVAMML